MTTISGGENARRWAVHRPRAVVLNMSVVQFPAKFKESRSRSGRFYHNIAGPTTILHV